MRLAYSVSQLSSASFNKGSCQVGAVFFSPKGLLDVVVPNSPKKIKPWSAEFQNSICSKLQREYNPSKERSSRDMARGKQSPHDTPWMSQLSDHSDLEKKQGNSKDLPFRYGKITAPNSPHVDVGASLSTSPTYCRTLDRNHGCGVFCHGQSSW